mgnify:CR=1 FL=1
MSIVTLIELLPLAGVLGLFLLPKGATTLTKQFALAASLIDLAAAFSLSTTSIALSFRSFISVSLTFLYGLYLFKSFSIVRGYSR